MEHTQAEKINAAHLTTKDASATSGNREVWPGDLVEVTVDVVLANDITAPIAIREFEKLGVERVFDPSRVVMVADHRRVHGKPRRCHQ